MEFTNEQLDQIQDFFGAVVDLIAVATDTDPSAISVEEYGPVAETLAETLTKMGYRVHFPWRDENEVTHDYYEED